jgi:hypothetical protein
MRLLSLGFFLVSLFSLGLSRRCGRHLYRLVFLGQDVTVQANVNLTPFVVGRRRFHTATWLVATQADILTTSVVGRRCRRCSYVTLSFRESGLALQQRHLVTRETGLSRPSNVVGRVGFETLHPMTGETLIAPPVKGMGYRRR